LAPSKSGYVYDSRGDVESRFTRDFLLTVATLYWATATITSSMRDYYDNRRWQGEPRLGPADLVRVPTAVAVFPHMLIPEGEPPREWAERLYDVHRWTVMPRGGHFASAEEPDLVARDVGDRSGGEAVHQGPERAAP
jgi:pimeloyl-ACP methyl ester carboxylesterase